MQGPLTIRRFRMLWMAAVVSNVGTFLYVVAAAWVMLELTGSALWVSAMAASATLPMLFLAVIAGAAADTINRRTVLLASQSLMGVAATTITLLEVAGAITPGLLLTLGLMMGVGIAFNLPAWHAAVPEIVPRGMVASAVALNSASFNVARAVGPAIGGVLIATVGPGAAFGINAVSFAGVIGVLASFPREEWEPEGGPSVMGAIATGLRFARFTKRLRWLLGLAAAFALTSGSLETLLPNLTDEVLGGGATMYGYLFAASGTGALSGALIRARLSHVAGRHSAPTSMIVFGAAAIVAGASREPLLTGAALMFAGAAWVWTFSTLNATVQLMSPSWVRGRMMSLYNLSLVGVLPIGALLGGVIAEAFGPNTAIVGLSAAGLAVGLAALRMPVIGLREVIDNTEAIDLETDPHGGSRVFGGPVLVVNTWVIAHDRLAAFMEVLANVRVARLTTGAYRWNLYRNVDEPHRVSEIFAVSSWDEHLRQHRRIDGAAAELIRQAREFDVAGGPASHHLVAFEVADPARRPDWQDLLVQHEEAHRIDGSIPLGDDDPVRARTD